MNSCFKAPQGNFLIAVQEMQGESSFAAETFAVGSLQKFHFSPLMTAAFAKSPFPPNLLP